MHNLDVLVCPVSGSVHWCEECYSDEGHSPIHLSALEERPTAPRSERPTAPRSDAPSPHDDGRDAWAAAVGNIETASGQRYDFENPRPETGP